MCIIAVKPRNQKLWSENTIREMFRRNPDGAGIMFLRKDGKVHIHKGMMKVEDVIKYLYHFQPFLEKTDVALHFRIGTSGKKDQMATHPYPVWSNNNSITKDVELAMMHNGILDSYGWRGNSEINDTQMFIKKTLRKLPHKFLKNKAIVELIEGSIGTNKLCFLGKDGFTLIGKFIEDNGYYYSNDTYKPFTFTSNHSYSRSMASCYIDDDEDDLFAWTRPKSSNPRISQELNTLSEINSRFDDDSYVCDDENEYYLIKEFFDNYEYMRPMAPSQYNDDAVYYDDDYLYQFDDSLLLITRYSLQQK